MGLVNAQSAWFHGCTGLGRLFLSNSYLACSTVWFFIVPKDFWHCLKQSLFHSKTFELRGTTWYSWMTWRCCSALQHNTFNGLLMPSYGANNTCNRLQSQDFLCRNRLHELNRTLHCISSCLIPAILRSTTCRSDTSWSIASCLSSVFEMSQNQSFEFEINRELLTIQYGNFKMSEPLCTNSKLAWVKCLLIIPYTVWTKTWGCSDVSFFVVEALHWGHRTLV